METFTAEQKKTFDTFDQYPWEADTVFQAGLDNILNNLPPDTTHDKDRQLLRAKHFFFSRFNQAFDLDQYIQYKQLGQQTDPKEARYQQLEQYDYDHDEKYLDELSSVVQSWVNQQTQQGVIWDKARLDQEFKKVQAEYYARHVDPSVDVNEYFAWAQEKKQANQSACPFAHLWQNKGSSKRSTASSAGSDHFVVSSSGRGATTLTLSSPSTQNILTIDRLNELRKALEASEQSQEATAHMLNTLVSSNVASTGLAYQETYDLAIQANPTASLEKLANSYYQSVEQTILSIKKPCIALMDGAIPTNASYWFLWHRFIRVVTEHAMLPLGLTLSHAPVPPLLLLTLCRSRKPNLPQGMELYLALAPPDLVRLRGPELLKLGLADVFVPGAQFHDVLETVKKMSLCPPPATATAIQLGLATAHTYPGPDRLGVWENEIQRVFAAESLEEIRAKLEQVNNHWSQSILDHWSTLPPTLLKVVFQAVKKCCSGMEPPHVFALEQSLNTQWRHSKDYATWLTTKDQEKVTWMDEEEAYPNDANVDQQEGIVIYQASETKEDDDTMAACPVTGQRSSGVCPVTGQASEVAASCPVTGQSSTSSACPMASQQSMTCPVTGQKGATCPISQS